MGKSTINGPFSIAMLVYQRVTRVMVDMLQYYQVDWVEKLTTGGEDLQRYEG